jgi:hypothetical protein
MSDNNSILSAMAAMQAELAKLKAENEALKAKKNKLSLKVSEKGAISLYGMGRFPVSLYPDQWDQVIGFADKIKAFVDENREEAEARSAAAKEKADDKPATV